MSERQDQRETVAAKLGIGTAEPQRLYDSVHNYHEALTQAGIKHGYYESPGTSHEWLTWRRDLREFAPLLFQGPDARPAAASGPPRGPGGFGGPIVLGPDDKQNYPEPPADIAAYGTHYVLRAVVAIARPAVNPPPHLPFFPSDAAHALLCVDLCCHRII